MINQSSKGFDEFSGGGREVVVRLLMVNSSFNFLEREEEEGDFRLFTWS